MVEEILNKVDKEIKAAEYKSFIMNMSRIDNKKEFNEILKSMSEEKKKDFEEALIGLTYYDELSSEGQKFLEKYEEYCIDVTTNNLKEYFNNSYLRFIFIGKVSEYRANKGKNVKMNGIDLSDLVDSLNSEYYYLIQKMDRQELTDDEKDFIKNYFYVCANSFEIQKSAEGGEAYDVVKFFDKYPLDDLEGPENRRMYILYTLSKELIKYDCNSLIVFRDFNDAKKRKQLGFFIKIDENTGAIGINRTHPNYLNSDNEFMRALFTLYHELGHFDQEFGNREFTDEEIELINMENDMIQKKESFYHKYHDNFYIERDADLFAAKLLRKNFHHKELDSFISGKLSGRRLIDHKLFISLFLKEYYSIPETGKLPSSSKNY